MVCLQATYTSKTFFILGMTTNNIEYICARIQPCRMKMEGIN